MPFMPSPIFTRSQGIPKVSGQFKGISWSYQGIQVIFSGLQGGLTELLRRFCKSQDGFNEASGSL